MKYNDEAVERLINGLVNGEFYSGDPCPHIIDLEDSRCTGMRCSDCWKQALAGEDK